MTREEAIEDIKVLVQDYIKCQGEEDAVIMAIDNVDVEALDMAIKALGQEPIIDKIRAEIESITPKAHIRTGKLSIDTELMIPLDRVLKVIDKYRAEGEE